MVTGEEAEALGRRLEELKCVDPDEGDGLFLCVLKKEPSDQPARYKLHLRECEYCRFALEVYRYKRDVAELLGKDAAKS